MNLLAQLLFAFFDLTRAQCFVHLPHYSPTIGFSIYRSIFLSTFSLSSPPATPCPSFRTGVLVTSSTARTRIASIRSFSVSLPPSLDLPFLPPPSNCFLRRRGRRQGLPNHLYRSPLLVPRRSLLSFSSPKFNSIYLVSSSFSSSFSPPSLPPPATP